jgi:hypothetical protein
LEREVGSNTQRKTGRGLFKHPCRKARARAVKLSHHENLQIPAIQMLDNSDTFAASWMKRIENPSFAKFAALFAGIISLD